MRTPPTPEVKAGDVVSLKLVETKTPMSERKDRWNEVKLGKAINDLAVGDIFALTFGRDDEYNLSKHGGMRTSPIESIEYNGDGTVVIKTMNSTYELTRENVVW